MATATAMAVETAMASRQPFRPGLVLDYLLGANPDGRPVTTSADYVARDFDVPLAAARTALRKLEAEGSVEKTRAGWHVPIDIDGSA